MVNIYKTKVDMTEDFKNMLIDLRKEKLRPLAEYSDLKRKSGNYEIVYVGPDDIYPHGAIVYVGAAENLSIRIGRDHLANFESSDLNRNLFMVRFVLNDKPEQFCSAFERWLIKLEKPVWNELVGFGNGPTMGRYHKKTYHTEFDFFHLRCEMANKPAPCSLTVLAKKLEVVKENYFNSQGLLVSWEVSDMIEKAYRSPAGYFDGQFKYVRPY